VPRLFLVDQEQVVAAASAADVHVFPDLDEALCAEDRETAVAPRAEAIRVNQSTRT
jgi:hypothetical protein